MQASTNLRHTLLGDCQAMRMQLMNLLQVFPELSGVTQIMPSMAPPPQRRMSAIPNDIQGFNVFTKSRSLSLPNNNLFGMQPMIDTMSPQSDLSNTFPDTNFISGPFDLL
ncbi:hypothetical protein DSO57_1024348 [Entomophthora muscae]|nr:hypothetical protein DSO57_1024348 [Entomophthora muscae]